MVYGVRLLQKRFPLWLNTYRKNGYVWKWKYLLGEALTVGWCSSSLKSQSKDDFDWILFITDVVGVMLGKDPGGNSTTLRKQIMIRSLHDLNHNKLFGNPVSRPDSSQYWADLYGFGLKTWDCSRWWIGKYFAEILMHDDPSDAMHTLLSNTMPPENTHLLTRINRNVSEARSHTSIVSLLYVN